MNEKASKANSLSLAKSLAVVLDDKKAGDLKVLDVSEQSSITNYLVLATGTSEPHLRALRIEVEAVMDSQKTHIVGTETAQESGWTVIDAFDVMVHLFTQERRKVYGLEKLWKDAVDVPLSSLLPKVEVPAPKKGVKKTPKKAVKKVAKKVPAKKVTKVKKPVKKAAKKTKKG